MVLKDGCFEQFVQDTAGKQIIIFGAGVLCNVWLPYLFAQYGITDRLLYCVDNYRHGAYVDFSGRAVPVYSFAYLKEHLQSSQVLLISVADYKAIIEQVEQCSVCSQLDCYIAPKMFIEHHHPAPAKWKSALTGEAKIPKRIHYIWFSDRVEYPVLIQKCIDSWRRFCPDYEIIRWDASSYDVTKNPYVYQAYQEKNWSLLSDFARLEILYEHGGIYFDTDVELLRGLDELLYQEAFISFEKWPVINSGGGMGAVQGFPLLREMISFRNRCAAVHAKEKTLPFPSGFYETKPLLAHGLRMDGETQVVNGMTVFSCEYFHPFDYMSGRCDIAPHTYAVHHFNRSWVPSKKGVAKNDGEEEGSSNLRSHLRPPGDGCGSPGI